MEGVKFLIKGVIRFNETLCATLAVPILCSMCSTVCDVSGCLILY